MKPQKAYYSVIQYCPDLARMEAANVGIVVFCPELKLLLSKIANANERVKQFFGAKGHDWQQINAFKRGLVKRIESHSRDIQSRESFEEFVRLQANVMRLTLPKPCKVSDKPEEDLDRLFQQLVGVPQKKGGKSSLAKKLGELFGKSGLIGKKIEENIPVRVPIFDREIKVPYGYRNGRFNLITPVSFKSDNESNLELTACRYAVEGKSLYDHPHDQYGNLQLLVVGQFKSDRAEVQATVQKILQENRVRLISSSNLDSLVQEIEKTGKDLSLS
jgi:hypothetical protein